MDLLTFAVITAAMAALVARLVEIGLVRPEAFAEIGTGARAFAEKALAESAALRRARQTAQPQPAPESADDVPAPLAA